MLTFVETYQMEQIAGIIIILLFGICIYGITDAVEQITKKD